MTVRVLGIRHHGPGSARAVRTALDELRPDAVVIEGAPELTKVIDLAAKRTMRPPVAGLVYAPDEPRTAGFYPMAVFSPEWVALRWAAVHGVPAQFTDLPAANALVLEAELAGRQERARRRGVRDDPIAALAGAAGSSDPERWWEDVIEHRYHGLAVFDAVLDAMCAVRERPGVPASRNAEPGDDRDQPDGDHLEHGDPDDAGTADVTAWDHFNDLREAAMRRTIRAVAREHATVAVVCGAWHAPALVPQAYPSATADNALLRGLPKVKVAATWVPWTSGRLAQASGYGAGVAAPGWYHHLFTTTADPVAGWLVDAAALLRTKRMDVSPASVIDSVRLAQTLATLRGRPLAGLEETTDAAQAVLCGGSPAPLTLIESELLVGHELGSVPRSTPMVPLAKDLERLQRRLRLKPSAAETTVTFDLRNPNHLAKSHLLHRLGLLDVDWGYQVETSTTGTFKESWVLQWRPELSIALIDASGSGTTVESAAATAAREQADRADTLRKLTDLVDRTLLAELADATGHIVRVLADRSAAAHDVTLLMEAVEPLARISRYGNVRRGDAAAVHHVLVGMTARIFVGLAMACASLDDDAARDMLHRVDAVQRAVALVDTERGRWLDALARVAQRRGVHGLIRGRASRLLLDAGRLDVAEARDRLSRTLSRAEDPVQGAAWIEGFVAGDAMLLIHDPELLAVVDRWVCDAAADVFDDLLPLLRRTFSSFTAPERRHIGERLRQVAAGTAPGPRDDMLDQDRAQRVLPVVLTMLGARDDR